MNNSLKNKIVYETIDFVIFLVVFCITEAIIDLVMGCLLYTSPSPRDLSTSRMPSSA